MEHNDNQPQEEDKSEDSNESVGQGDNSRAMGIISYLGPLCIIPILTAKDSEFAMYHANQGLILFIAEMILFAVGIIPILGWLISIFGNIAAVIFAIIGILNAANMKKKPLPVIGGYQLLK